MNPLFRTRTVSTMMMLTLGVAAQAEAAGPRPAVVRMQPAVFERADASMTAVNDCAAQIMTRDLDFARTACDRAVSIVKKARPVYLRKSLTLAAALSNHALLELLSGDLMAAQADITRAIRLAPDQTFVARNRLAIEYALAERRIAQE